MLPHDWKAGEDGYSEEEIKMIKETKKIMGDDSILVSPTTARVPVRVGHSEAVNIEFHKPISVGRGPRSPAQGPRHHRARRLRQGRSAVAADVPSDRDEVFVGRIRRDPTVANGLNLWVVADNLRKGAATNAVQIAEVLVQRGWLPRK